MIPMEEEYEPPNPHFFTRCLRYISTLTFPNLTSLDIDEYIPLSYLTQMSCLTHLAIPYHPSYSLTGLQSLITLHWHFLPRGVEGGDLMYLKQLPCLVSIRVLNCIYHKDNPQWLQESSRALTSALLLLRL